LIIYFQTDCPFCHDDIPLWKEIYHQAATRNINVVAVTPETDTNNLVQFANEKQLAFPILIDPERKLLNQLEATVTPTKILLDPSNRVVQIWRGLTTQRSGDDAMGGLLLIFGIEPHFLPVSSSTSTQ
jgi:peroxiredoxin